MLYSYKWLKELSKTSKGAQEVADLLLTHSFEVEDVRPQASGLEDVYIGHVLAVQKHPDADKLNVATVDMGEEKLQIVCGAPNLSEGQKVPVAIVGAVLPGDFAIKKSTIRGVESAGMICAPDEIGLGSDHDGILVLEADAPLGISLVKHMKLDDILLDIDVLPNRAHDALSHRGMANEIAMLEGRVLAFQDEDLSQIPEGVEVEILTPQCTRYAAVTLQGIEVKPSPTWLQDRLRLLGHKPINNVVDITNYVMLETGQPLHAFTEEFATHIAVRQATTDEKMTLLDDTEVILSNEDIVITDTKSPIALAGVMGGKGSAIAPNTTSVILEAANFNARSIRATKSRHNLQTDAAYRFERDIDPNLISQAITRASELFREICSASITQLTDVYPEPIKPWSVALVHGDIEKLLGINLEHAQVQKILTDLEIVISQKTDAYLCHIPTKRRDLTAPEDLIEEIGRVYGYEKIRPRPLNEPVQAPAKNEQRAFERMTKNFLTHAGFDEVRSYSFYSAKDASAVGLSGPHVSLANPMSSEQDYMRRTLAVGLIRSSVINQSHGEQTKLFEVGRFYTPTASGLPQEKLTLGITATSKSPNGEQFYAVKGLVDQFLSSRDIVDHYYSDEITTDTADSINFHPSRRALIHLASGEVIGSIGEIAKNTAKHFSLKNAHLAFCEIDLDRIRNLTQQFNEFKPLDKFPSIHRDLSIVVSSRTRVADIQRLIAAHGTDLLKNIDLFDLYINPKNDERSMAFHLTFNSSEKTLESPDIEKIITKIVSALEDEGATLKKN